MVKEYKELLITNELLTARKAKAEGRFVILSYPLAHEHPDVEGCEHNDGNPLTKVDDLSFCDFPYAIENAEELDEAYLDKVICRMKGDPCHITDTQRCRIREITVRDVDELYRIYSEPGITNYVEALCERKEDEIAYIRDYIRYQYGFYDYGIWIVEDKKSGIIIGRAGFDMRQGYEEPEMGYLIRKSYQRKGYAAEICEELLSFAREKLGFVTVRAFTNPGNEASVRLLEKLGFELKEYTAVPGSQKQRREKIYAHYIYHLKNHS